MSKSALKHIEHLSVTIGPRGSGTDKEREAHEYVQEALTDLGAETWVENYTARTSTYTPFVLGLGLVLVAEVLFWFIGRTADAQAGALAAFVLSLAALIALILELQGLDNPLRWFVPTAPSQNVIGVTKSKSKHPRRVAILAHVDSHKTPLIWYSPATFMVYRILTTLGLLGLVALMVLYAVFIFSPLAALHTYSLIPAAVILLAWLMVTQAHFTPYTHGANDNASGVGVMLALAEKLKKKPLKNTEIWWVATGCEENGPYGSPDFVRRHKDELKDGTLIVVDNIAGEGTGPVYLTSEGVFFPVKYPADVLALVNEIAEEHPEWGGHAVSQSGAYTDATAGLQAGLKCLTFVGYNRSGWIPNWHNASDVFENVDAEAVDSTEKFVTELLKRLDA